MIKRIKKYLYNENKDNINNNSIDNNNQKEKSDIEF